MAGREIQGETRNSYLKQGNDADRLCHFPNAGDYRQAGRLLSLIADNLVRNRKFDVLEAYMKELPASVLEEFPTLMVAQGNLCRLMCRFDEASIWYREAKRAFERRGDKQGIGSALRGEALIYLDTVQPAKAEKLLTRALNASQSDLQEYALTLRLLAENKTNEGRPIVAEALLKRAGKTGRQPEVPEDAIELRTLLRSGRLDRAHTLAETIIAEEQRANQQERVARSHREAVLVLSLIHSWEGAADKARQYAEDGLILGQQLNSPFVEAVAYMRLGHAYQITPDAMIEDTVDCYQSALNLCDVLHVRRGRSEPLMGLCLLSGFNGDLALAERYGQEALKIAQQAGDEWMAGLCMLALGIAQANTGRAALAMTTLSRAASTFTICGDSYNLALARLWLALVAIHQARTEEFLMHATSLFKMTRAQNYDFLFSKNTLFGPRQPSAVASILMEAKKQGIERDYITCLPTEVNLHKALSYPNYLLRIQALGPLRVWRGQDEIKDVGGKRLKARALFGLLITYRPELLHKEQIMDMLWPEASADAAYRNFRVTLNALNVSLQPERESYARPLYILRYGQSYGLNLAACYRLDVEEFESLVNKAACLEDTDDNNAIELYRQALELYKGDYLKDFLYEEWSSKERQRVTEVYLRAAEKLAHLLVKTQDYEGCIETCNRILAKDNCWEGAYRLLMSCYYKLGDRPAALRIYHECVESLQQELGVPPMSSTSHLYGRICQSAV